MEVKRELKVRVKYRGKFLVSILVLMEVKREESAERYCHERHPRFQSLF